MSQQDEKKVEDFRALEAIMRLTNLDRLMPFCLPMMADALIGTRQFRAGEMVICVDTILVQQDEELPLKAGTQLEFTPEKKGDHCRWSTQLYWGPADKSLKSGQTRIAICSAGDYNIFVWPLDELLLPLSNACPAHRYIREYLERRRSHVGTVHKKATD